jgi:hypothetical protein
MKAEDGEQNSGVRIQKPEYKAETTFTDSLFFLFILNSDF